MNENVNVMEVIWQAVDKAEDGCVYYPVAFVDFLWDNGFVDTKKFKRERWDVAFEPFKQADGLFKLTHEEFLTLNKYRYSGEIHIPFDAMRINEGKYTDEGFGQLVSDSIAPSCAFADPELQKFVGELTKEFKQPDDLILIQKSAKFKIKKLLEDSPSPLRRLELLFDNLLKKKGIAKEVEQDLQKISLVATPEQQAELQASTFIAGPSNLSESEALKLKQITKVKKNGEPAPQGGEPLKKIKRSKKGLRG